MKAWSKSTLWTAIFLSPFSLLRAQSPGGSQQAAAPTAQNPQQPPAQPSSDQASQKAEPAPAAAAAAAALAPPSSPTAAPKGFTLEDATPVKLRTTRELSSATETTGQQVDFEVTEDVKVNNVAVIPQGGVAWGTVTEAQHKRHMGRGGKLNISIEKVRLTDGEKVALRAVKDTQGGGHVGAMTTGLVVTGIVFFPVAPLFLFMHGKDITIPKGTEVTAYISGDVALDPARFGVPLEANASGSAAQSNATAAAAVPAAALADRPAAPAANASEAATGTVEIKSTPDAAEITVDGKFMGTTPSALRLPPGDHTIRLEKAGYKPWERVLTVSGGSSTTIGPTLEHE